MSKPSTAPDQAFRAQKGGLGQKRPGGSGGGAGEAWPLANGFICQWPRVFCAWPIGGPVAIGRWQKAVAIGNFPVAIVKFEWPRLFFSNGHGFFCQWPGFCLPMATGVLPVATVFFCEWPRPPFMCKYTYINK